MRLDHLLSKETSISQVAYRNVLRSEFLVCLKVALFNLEGIRQKKECDEYGPIAQLARAHD